MQKRGTVGVLPITEVHRLHEDVIECQSEVRSRIKSLDQLATVVAAHRRQEFRTLDRLSRISAAFDVWGLNKQYEGDVAA